MMQDSGDNALEERLLADQEQDHQECEDQQEQTLGENAATNAEAPPSVAGQAVLLFAFTVNYIFGAGVLGIPYAVAHGGIIAASVTLVISSALGLLSMVWVLECQERANCFKGTTGIVEFSTMCELFIGRKTRTLYEVSLTLFVLSSAWMYASIFSVSLAKSVPIMSDSSQCDLASVKGFLWNVPHKSCWGDYLIYLGIFALLMSILVQTDLAKMKVLQLTFTCVGLFALFLMVITVGAAMPEDGFADIDTSLEVFNASSFGAVFGTFVFAQLCHHGVPLLSHIPERRDIVRPVFVAVIGTTTSLYLVLGVMCAIFFGVVDDVPTPRPVNKLITLNWADYTAGAASAGPFAQAVSYYVRLYPAITCGAAFPLYAITLGNGWYHSYYGGETPPPGVGFSRRIFYLAATFPAIFCAAFMADVSFMLILVGISAFIIAFFIPPSMQLQSRRIVPECVVTRYSWHFSKPFYCYVCLIFACIAFCYTVISAVNPEVEV
ncbi:Amino acid transporter, putative [Hondaea fermentalgiana]|uniref:Amino acid transporter, putative n=1 Tax=Hondaea fermentalgiana TaxID=2315210 RepID=A0A2R5GH46_9STRA|nr:Amino acid transporter, putative [Hondaea fermentalgiana]|eukprot:GBG29068.1 Amino acid transporter, putative [Hondaea fermentalgiana]